jgi:hypothetical protein
VITLEPLLKALDGRLGSSFAHNLASFPSFLNLFEELEPHRLGGSNAPSIIMIGRLLPNFGFYLIAHVNARISKTKHGGAASAQQ